MIGVNQDVAYHNKFIKMQLQEQRSFVSKNDYSVVMVTSYHYDVIWYKGCFFVDSSVAWFRCIIVYPIKLDPSRFRHSTQSTINFDISERETFPLDFILLAVLDE
jgi:hypothetical protein